MFWLHVPMHDPMVVRVAQRGRHVVGQPHHILHRERAVPVQTLAQRLTLDVGHHVVKESVRFARIVERQDVRMAEPRRDLDLADKPFGAERGSEFGTEDLYGHLALVLKVLGEVDRGHAARANLPLDGVAAGEGGF